jgi:hypothetical protein
MSPGGSYEDTEEETKAELEGERICPSAWMGLTMPPSKTHAIWEKTPWARMEAMGEDDEGGLVGDDAVNTDEDRVDKEDELMEAA